MIENRTPAQLLRVFVSEADKVGHKPLYETIVQAARKADLAGATVWRGVLSYGHSSHIHTRKILELASDLPTVVEIIDEMDKIETFLPTLTALFDQAGVDGLITLENIQVLRIENGQVKMA